MRAAQPAGGIDRQGWFAAARQEPSPNCDPRPPGCSVDLLLLHNISLPPGEFGGPHIERLFTNQLDLAVHPFFATLAGVRVSAHFLIARDGSTVQFVSTHARAWHAGASSFEGRTRCNDFSVGVELEGTDFMSFTSAQYTALAVLTGALRAAHPLRAVRGHCHVARERKTDPGPLFDWQRLAQLAALPPAWLPPLR